MQLKNPKDFWSGVMFAFVGFSFAAMVKIFEYRMGTPIRMGPGYFPFFLGLILGVLGLVIIAKAWVTQGERVPKFAWRPLFWILGAVLLFGLVAKIVGLFISIILVVVVATYGGHEFRLKEVVISSLVLAAACTVLFVVLLGLSFPIWPDVAEFTRLFQK